MEDQPINHHAIVSKWMAMIVGALMIASVAMTFEEGATGMISYDKGPVVDLDPDLIDKSDYRSNLGSGVMTIILLIVLQIGIYFLVTWELENEERKEQLRI